MPPQVLKPSYLEIHRRNEHKNTPTFRNLIISATDSMSSLISSSNCYDTTIYSIVVNYEATNMTSGAGNSISGTDVYSETT